jgi:hypothetical protein
MLREQFDMLKELLKMVRLHDVVAFCVSYSRGVCVCVCVCVCVSLKATALMQPTVEDAKEYVDNNLLHVKPQYEELVKVWEATFPDGAGFQVPNNCTHNPAIPLSLSLSLSLSAI